MSETLWGVVVGGLIGSVSSFLLYVFDYSKWRKERYLEILKNKREILERTYNRALEYLRKGKDSDGASYDIDLWTDMELIMPDSVDQACRGFIKETGDTLAQKGAMYKVQSEMKKNLKEIDIKIENVVGPKKYWNFSKFSHPFRQKNNFNT